VRTPSLDGRLSDLVFRIIGYGLMTLVVYDAFVTG
jgi:hypothetical protein